jgi:hypothetical protein
MALNEDDLSAIRDIFNEAMNAPMATLTVANAVPEHFVGYRDVLGLDPVVPESVTTVTHTGGPMEPGTLWMYPPGDSGEFRIIPDLTAPMMPNPGPIRTGGPFSSPYWTDPNRMEPFVLPDPTPMPTAEGIMELMRATMQRNRNTITKEEPDLSEMIKTVHFYPGGQCVILVNGPKINADTSDIITPKLSPEQIQILDRELKAAIIRAFSLVADPKKLQEYKRTLIVD